MSERVGDWHNYIEEGRSGVNVFQSDFGFFYTPEIRLQGNPVRTLVDFMEDDLPQTAARLPRIYVPLGVEDDGVEDTLELAFEWVRENLNVINVIDPAEYPSYVSVHFQTATFYYSFHDSKPQTNPELNTQPIAYSPSSQDWEKDIRIQTIEMFDHLKKQPLRYGKKYDPNSFSTSKNLDMMTRMFFTKENKYRVYGADALVYELLKTYWLGLKRRAEILAESR